MFRPNVPCVIRRLADGYDVFGQRAEANSWPSMCGIVMLRASDQQTTVRADSSASRGFADEDVAQGKLLFSPASGIREDDIVEVAGMTVQVKTIHPRYAIAGRLDHYEVGCITWASA